MKTYNVITLFPEMMNQICSQGVLGQAQKSGLIAVKTHNPRNFTSDVHKTVDDRPFGGGDGMLMMIEPLQKTLESIANSGPVIYLSPQGPLFTDQKAQELAKLENVTLLCGRYAGVDQRFINHFVDTELSIGDYVLSGGEIAAAAVIDASSRFVPGVLGHEESAQKDSLTSGQFEAPAFTRPREWGGEEVPLVLLSGHHAHIEKWKQSVGILVTLHKRPEALKIELSSKSAQELIEFARSLTASEKKSLGLVDFEMDRLSKWLGKFS